jgi:hypothetical protein
MSLGKLMYWSVLHEGHLNKYCGSIRILWIYMSWQRVKKAIYVWFIVLYNFKENWMLLRPASKVSCVYTDLLRQLLISCKSESSRTSS